MPPALTPRASYARSALAFALSLLASATIVACQPAAGTAAAEPAPAAAPLTNGGGAGG